MPGLSSNMVNEFKLLIAETLDMDTNDRAQDTGDLLRVTSDFADKYAHPYQDQTSGYLSIDTSGNDDYVGYAISGNEFAPFKDYTVESKKFGILTTEYQKFYVAGKSYYKDAENDVLFKGKEAVYQIYFGPDEKGLPLCPGDTSKNVSSCGGSEGVGAARYVINFLGEPWVISDLKISSSGSISGTPTKEDQVGVPSSDDFTLYLAKEAQYGILNIGDCLTSDEVKVCLGDIARETGENNEHPAIINVYIGNSTEPTIKDQVNPGTTKNIYVNGKEYKVHVYQTAPGYTLGEKWAEMAIYKDEIELHNGKRFLKYEDKDSDWKVYMGLIDKDASTTNQFDIVGKATHLKEIIFQTYRDDAFGKNGYIRPGEAMKVLDVGGYQAYELYNNGLEDVDMDTLSISTTTNDEWSEEIYDTGTGNALYNYTIPSSDSYYITITSEDDRAFEFNGRMGSELVITYHNDSNDNETVFLHGKDDKWYYLGPTSGSVKIRYRDAGTTDGFINITDVDTSGGEGDFGIDIVEEIGPVNNTDSVGYISIDAKYHSGDPKLLGRNSADEDKIGYEPPSGIDSGYGYGANDYEDGFITPRGSIFEDTTGTSKEISIAKKIRHLDMLFKPTQEAADKVNTQTCGPLREGESCKVGDVTVTVKSIDVSTSVAAGSGAAGTCDMSGVSAVIKADGQPVGDNAKLLVPYEVQGNMVVLDSEVSSTDSGTLITVGGPAVNSVTAEALPDGITADEPVVVKQVGNKIVVAGYTASDTLQAAQQFIQSLTTQ